MLAHKIQEIYGTVKRPILRIIGTNVTENIFNKIVQENFPKIKKEMPIKVQVAFRTTNRLGQKENPLQYNNQNTQSTKQS